MRVLEEEERWKGGREVLAQLDMEKGALPSGVQVSSGDSEAKPLIFTFVPTVRRLPTHSQLADISKFLVKIPEEPSDKNPETVNRSNFNEYLTLNAGSQQERDPGTLTYPSEVSGKILQVREFKANEPQEMQQSGLFKAEYVFIVDSEGEDEATSRKVEQTPPVGMGTTATRPKSLAISSSLVSDVVRPKTQATNLQAPSHPEMPHGMASQQKHGQLTSPSTTSEQLACKPPALSFVSPTNQQTPPDPVNLAGASVLEEFHTRRLNVSGALVEETATYFQTSAHSSPFFASKGTSSTLELPHSAQLSGPNLSSPSEADQKPGLTSEALRKTTPASHVLSPRESLKTSASPSSGASPKSNSALYIPVRIVMHSLSPSPKPFTSSFHGSSSTICSPASSSGNLSKSGVKSPVPSRLSLLTAILKSNPSHQRPFSPASCPTFSLNSLASSTLTLDQKEKQTLSTPKKSLSSGSLRTGSPEQREHQVSDIHQQSFHLPFFTQSASLSQAPSLSPTQPVSSSSLASLNVEKTPSPTLKSNPPLSLLQTKTLSPVGLPPVPPSFSPFSWKGKRDADLRGLEKPRNIYTYPSESASCTLSSPFPTNQRATLSSPEKGFHPSPALSNMINRSQRAPPQISGQGQNPSAPPSPPVSSASSASHPKLGSFPLPHTNLPTQALRLSPSALHPNCGSGTLPSRLGKSESSISDHRSSVSTPSPPTSLTRTKEPISPCALPTSADSENKKPKQYKTKSSYKAFAAIPTNILLLEQKALDEPVKTESISKDNTLDLPLEFCSPAQLRQQTEELCATIDKVLQDSLSMHSSDSPSSSLQTLLGSNTIKKPTTLPRAAGRETKYANLSSPSSTVSESQLTKPGVIRPVPVKSRILLKKEEEVYEPNPFSKYLEDNSDLFSEQEVTVPHKPAPLHPLYQTKLYPPAKSLLHPQTLSHADCLTPGPFSHLSSFSLTDEPENSHTRFSHNAYNKLNHPMVAIPEHEALDSKEMRKLRLREIS
ncbi:muscular LMNA-interacting protein isoform X4 [Desmodus rotundus]|uniref:muscular LMNA-interacting protein isoform X4 n=1 Tax=Desmodus rotundus TaxID=9430 RepID=UPI00238144A0|nr:muscular LMNA-interacting protein isoform X4 [Desmodus rotundus]